MCAYSLLFAELSGALEESTQQKSCKVSNGRIGGGTLQAIKTNQTMNCECFPEWFRRATPMIALWPTNALSREYLVFGVRTVFWGAQPDLVPSFRVQDSG